MDIAFVGCGRQAAEHARAVQKLGHRVSQCVASNPNSLSAQQFSQEFGCSIVELDRIQCDRLVVSTPMLATGRLSRWIIDHVKCPVLVEKPFLAAVTEYADHVSVGYNRRFYSTVQTLRELMQVRIVESVIFVINELIADKARRLGLTVEQALQYSFGHSIDLMYYLGIDRRPSVVKLFCNKAINTKLTVIFADGSAAELSSFEQLTVYDRLEYTTGTIKKYVPRVELNITEPKKEGIKEGIFEQMRSWLNGQPLATMVDERRIIKYISENCSYS